MDKLKKIWADQRGNFSLIWASILITFFLGICAVVIDGGTAVLKKHIILNVGDAAALAGSSAVEGKLVFDDFGNPVGEMPVLNPIIADTYAAGTLDANMAAMKFNQRGIALEETYGAAVDADGDGYIESYSLRLRGTIDAPLFGPVLGLSDRIPFDKTVVAKVRQD